MEFRLMSDVHNEFSHPVAQYQLSYVPGDENRVLIIAGDYTVLSKPDIARGSLIKLSNRFKAILYVPGNHEYYKGRIDPVWADRMFGRLTEGLDNVHFLRRKSIVIDGIRVVGATLWTNMDKANPIVEWELKMKMNDFRAITYYDERLQTYSKFRPVQWINEHVSDFSYIKQQVAESQEPVIVVTHHAPSARSLDPKFANDRYGNFGYHSVLDDYILDNPKIKYWCHGHIHDPKDYMIGDTNVLCNPYGYPGEDVPFLDRAIYHA